MKMGEHGMDGEKLIVGILGCLVALFSIAASVFNWDFFFDNRKARPFVKILGRNGARIFYGALGVFIFIMVIMGISASP